MHGGLRAMMLHWAQRPTISIVSVKCPASGLSRSIRSRADDRRAREQPSARRQQRLHRLVVVRALPIPLRQVHLGTEVQVAPVRPLAQPADAVVEQLTRRLGCEQRAARRVEGEDAVGSGGDRPPALVDQVVMATCRA